MFLQKGNQSIDIVPGRFHIVEVVEDIVFKLGTVVQLFVDSRIALLYQEEAIHDLFVVSAHRFLYGRALEVFKWHNWFFMLMKWNCGIGTKSHDPGRYVVVLLIGFRGDTAPTQVVPCTNGWRVQAHYSLLMNLTPALFVTPVLSLCIPLVVPWQLPSDVWAH